MRGLLPSDRTQRWLALGNLVNMTGTGATAAVLVVFLAHTKELPLAQASSLLAVSGLVGVVGSVPVGWLSDRVGARLTAITTELVCASATVVVLVADSTWTLVAGLAIRQLSTSGNSAARAALMGALVPPDQRTRLRAYQRSVTNIGFAVGGAASALALATNSGAALAVVLAADAATFCFSAYATSRLPDAGRTSTRRGLALNVLTDRGYLTVGALNAAHALNRAAVSLGLPLWIVYGSTLPDWTISAAMVLNTVLVIVLQVPLSRSAHDVAGARRTLLAAGGFTALGCTALAGGGIASAGPEWAFLAAACVTLTFGEILGAAAGWTLSYELAPPERFGEYLGTWQLMADGSAKIVGPVLLGWAVAIGPAGWTILAAGFAITAMASPLVITRSTASRREPATARAPG